MKFIPYLLLIVVTGCASPKFYPEVKSTTSTRYINKRPSIFKNSKKVFFVLKDQLNTTNHIVCFYSLTKGVDFGSNVFSVLIFDVDNSKYYFVGNSEDHPNIIIRQPLTDLPESYQYYVVSKYLNGEVDYLIKLGKNDDHGEIRYTETIFDIDLEKNEIKRYEFDDFLFSNGKPLLETYNIKLKDD